MSQDLVDELALAAKARRDRLDELTRKHTAEQKGFAAFCDVAVASNYTPTIYRSSEELAELAEAFDVEMDARGSSIRAWPSGGRA